MLATTGLGAIWSSASPDFGVNGIEDRFGQIEPKVLVAVNGYGYNGKTFSRLEEIRELRRRIPSIEAVVIISNLAEEPIPDEPGMVSWDAAVAEGRGRRCTSSSCPSTTRSTSSIPPAPRGCPSASSTAVAARCSSTPRSSSSTVTSSSDDTFFYFTTAGWMMWNWLVSGLLTGAELVLFDGSPGYPSLDVLWELAETEGITHFGTSAKFLGGCRNARHRPGRTTTSCPAGDLFHRIAAAAGRLRLTSTRRIKRRRAARLHLRRHRHLLLLRRSACPILPVRRGEIPCAGSGHGREGLQRRRRSPWSTNAASWSAPSRHPACRSCSGTTRT
ncbi:MAG: hypothetical protein U5L11_06410 [Arhodomonas sp.]|nr:hypothetical protein [Arhodomonas sp.]